MSHSPEPPRVPALPAELASLIQDVDVDRLLLESSLEGLLVHSQGVILAVNPAICRLTGYELSELVGNAGQTIIAPECRELVRAMVREERTGPYEAVLLHKDGSRIPVEIIGRTMVHRGVRLRASCVRDIRPRREAEAAALESQKMLRERELQTERLLRASEERFRSLAEASPLGLHTYQLQSGQSLVLTGANSAADHILNLKHTPLIGQTIEQAFPDLERAGIPAIYRRVIADGKPWRSEQVHYFEGRVQSAYEINAFRTGPESLAVLFQDIRERLVAQAALHLQSAALESAANGVLITDRSGRIVWCNPAFSRMTGYGRSELVGQSTRILSSGRSDKGFYKHLWETILAGKVWRAEFWNQRKDRTLYMQEQTITPVVSAQGEITHFVAIQQDTTERQRMEAELRHSMERFQGIFQTSPLAISLTRVADNRILDVNPSYIALTGFAHEEMVGKTSLELGLWADETDRPRLIANVEKEGLVRNFEMRMRIRSGRLKDMLLSVVKVRFGNDDCLITMATDITERKRLEVQLRQAAKMESLGTLAGGVAHDFNNLLTVIQGHVSMAMTSATPVPEEVDDHLEQIQQASERAANLTRQLLAFSRQETIKPRHVDLNDVLAQQTKMLRRIIGEDVNMKIMPASMLPAVLADQTMMEQVLLNLAANARDAMPEGGTLVISTDAVSFEAGDLEAHPLCRPGRFVRLAVRDTGRGIPPEILPRIFEPFFTTKESGKGTGLGLATVHGIVRRHEGWIEVESDPWSGTTFRLYLPALDAQAAPSQADIAWSHPARGRGKILLVEDEDAVRFLARRILENCGYQVTDARNGVEALRVVEKEPVAFELLLTDVVMPGGITGRDLSEHLCTRTPGLKVVLMSGYSPVLLDDPDPYKKKKYFLQKPFTPQELARVVHECLEGT